MKRILFISHRMGRTKSRKTAHKCRGDSSDDGGGGLIPYRTAKTFTVAVKCFDCFLLRKTAKFVACRNILWNFGEKIQRKGYLKADIGNYKKNSINITKTEARKSIESLFYGELIALPHKNIDWQCYIARYP